MRPRIEPPPAADVDALHAASLRVLEDVGVAFPSRAAQQLLGEAGAAVDAESGVVRMPPRLVDDALRAAPSELLLAGRDPAQDVRCGGPEGPCLTLDGTGAYTLDHRSGERRASTMQDLADATRVADAAPEIGVVWNSVSAGDAPPATQVLAELHTCLTNTGKHVQGEVQRAAEVPYVMRILAAAGGGWDPGRPFFSIVYCPVPPLQHEPDMLEAALALAHEGVPMCVYSMGLAGATAPVTPAGAVVQANAEILSSVVLFQLARPGLGCVYVADTGVLDMHSGMYLAAAPEGIIMTQAMVGLARRYGLPVMASGFTGDSRGFSAMSGSDAGTTVLASVLMDPDLLVGAGMHAGAQLLSLPKILLDCELFRFCLHVRDGLRVDEEDLMTGVIARVGPGGHFLGEAETRRYLRAGRMYRPRLLRREPPDAPRGGPADEVGRATDAVEGILAGHRPPPLPAGADEAIAGVLAEAGRALAAR